VRARDASCVTQGVRVEGVAEHAISDSELEAAVQAALTCDVFVPATITAKVRGGQVTLEGEVVWTFHRRMAASAVCSLAGVVAVHDSIRQASQASASRVKAKVRASLQRHRGPASA
jgi:osmotically-inducible protein OsmY